MATRTRKKSAAASETAAARAVLRSRAEQLAKPPETQMAGRRVLDILEFSLGREHYAFPADCVREVFRLTEITSLPGLPPYILGVINVRGRILSVMDIRRFLEFTSRGLTNLSTAIILQHDGMEFAVLADEVVGASTVDMDDEQLTLPTLSKKQEEYLKGITAGRIAVLDAEKLLSSTDIIIDQKSREV
jgi:purine-binding chemotaxis protein CheW